MTEEDLFLAALDRPDPAERQKFLDGACAENPELRKRIDALLSAFAAGKEKLEPPQAGEETQTAPGHPATIEYKPGAEPGTTIAGRYKLQERIGEGGMGEVWVAKQTEPVQRKVALKLIKAGMDSKSVLGRFEAERQALALMDHPNIAKVLDGGLTAEGRPFFVMELVNGQPLTKFCDEAKLTPRERLELFVPVCQAIQHAHQKGIVHRDLKPTNILVTLYDGRPVPKVIDFGVAKATGGRLTEETLSTQFGAVVGTFEYMAPEQAGFSALDVDTRADVYSLGVILYELLTGLRPFEGSRLRKAAIDELFRILREEEPPRPSTKLSTDASLPSAAAVRRTDPKKLAALMRGELDWIVMKCLEKDRSRRYETVSALARDVERYLADEPVEARPPSARYRARKFIRRNRGRVVAAALVLLVLVAGVVGTTAGLIEARGQRDAARRAEQQADADRTLAVSEFRRAEAEGARARAAEIEQGKARKQAEDARIRSDGLRLASEASIARPADPGLALLLGLEGVRRYPHHITFAALYDAAADLHERRTIATGLFELKGVRLNNDATKALAFSPYGYQHAATTFDLTSGNSLTSWQGVGYTGITDVDWSPDGVRAVVTIPNRVSVVFTDGQKPERATFTDRVAYVWDTATGRDLVHLRRHDDKVVSARFNRDGTKIVTASWDSTAKIWDVVSGKELHVLRGHTNSLHTALFSPDGKRVLTVSSQMEQTAHSRQVSGKSVPDNIPNADPGLTTRPYRSEGSGGGWSGGTARQMDVPFARLWDADTGMPIRGFDFKSRPSGFNFAQPQSVAFSPDGSRVAVGFNNDTIGVWDANTGQQQAEFSGHKGQVLAVAFSPDGTQLASAGYGPAVLVWDLSTGQATRRLEGHTTNTVNDVRFSADGRRLVTAGEDRTARVWQVSSGKELAVFRGHTAPVRAAHFLDSNTVLTAAGSTLRIWSVAAPQPIPTRLYEPDPPSGRLATLLGSGPARHTGPVTAIAFSPDSASVYTGSNDRTVRRWDVTTGRQTALVMSDLRGAVRGLQVGPGGTVYSGTDFSYHYFPQRVVDRETFLSMVHRWDPASGKATRFLKGQNAGILHFELSADGKRLVIRCLPSMLKYRTGSPNSVESNYDNQLPDVTVWDVVTGEQISTLPLASNSEHWPWPRFSSDGTKIVYLTPDTGGLALFDARTGKLVHSLTGANEHRGAHWMEAAFSPDGQIVVGQMVGDRDLQFWDASTGMRLGSFRNADQPASRHQLLSFSPDSKRLAVSFDRIVQIVDMATRNSVRELRGHEAPLLALVFSPDGTKLLTGSEDKTAALWDVDSGSLLAVYRGHAGGANLVAFSPDGKRVATAGGAEPLARVWNLDVVPEFEKRKPRDLTPEERVRYELPPAAQK